jgi:hypothetical protein
MNGNVVRYQLAERWASKTPVPASPVPIGKVVHQGAVPTVVQSKRKSAMRTEKCRRLRSSARQQRGRRGPAGRADLWREAVSGKAQTKRLENAVGNAQLLDALFPYLKQRHTPCNIQARRTPLMDALALLCEQVLRPREPL